MQFKSLTLWLCLSLVLCACFGLRLVCIIDESKKKKKEEEIIIASFFLFFPFFFCVCENGYWVNGVSIDRTSHWASFGDTNLCVHRHPLSMYGYWTLTWREPMGQRINYSHYSCKLLQDTVLVSFSLMLLLSLFWLFWCKQGAASGTVILLISKGKSSHILVFDEELFFVYLLPPIIFNAG